MRYDAEWGVGGLIVLLAFVAWGTVLESEKARDERLLRQQESDEAKRLPQEKEAALDLERSRRRKEKLWKDAVEQVNKEEEEEARAKKLADKGQ